MPSHKHLLSAQEQVTYFQKPKSVHTVENEMAPLWNSLSLLSAEQGTAICAGQIHLKDDPQPLETQPEDGDCGFTSRFSVAVKYFIILKT